MQSVAKYIASIGKRCGIIPRTLSDKIEVAADFNILVYDADANSGEFTSRLITLAIGVSTHSEEYLRLKSLYPIGELRNIYVKDESHIKLQFNETYKVIEDKRMVTVFKDHNVHIQQHDKHAVLFEFENGLLLGSY